MRGRSLVGLRDATEVDRLLLECFASWITGWFRRTESLPCKHTMALTPFPWRSRLAQS